MCWEGGTTVVNCVPNFINTVNIRLLVENYDVVDHKQWKIKSGQSFLFLLPDEQAEDLTNHRVQKHEIQHRWYTESFSTGASKLVRCRV